MIYYLIPIFIILLISVFAVFYFDNNESFSDLKIGTFDASSYTNHIKCLTGIANGNCKGIDADEIPAELADCAKACKNIFQNTGECAPLPIDIRGKNVEQCVKSCGENGGAKCSEDSNGNQIDINTQTADYLKKYESDNISQRKASGESLNELITKNKCLKECLKCGWNVNNVNDNCKCSWATNCVDNIEQNYEAYKAKWNSPDHNFLINAIPENRKITLSWVEQQQKNVESYICYIFTKDKIGEVEIKTIELTNSNLKEQNPGNYIYTINNRENNILYGIQLNKLSKTFPGHNKLVKTSNTIYVKPSTINIIDYSRDLNSNTDKCSHLAENLLDNFKGKEFDINFG